MRKNEQYYIVEIIDGYTNTGHIYRGGHGSPQLFSDKENLKAMITTITGIALISVIGGYATIIILAGLLVTVLALIHVPSKDTGK